MSHRLVSSVYNTFQRITSKLSANIASLTKKPISLFGWQMKWLVSIEGIIEEVINFYCAALS